MSGHMDGCCMDRMAHRIDAWRKEVLHGECDSVSEMRQERGGTVGGCLSVGPGGAALPGQRDGGETEEPESAPFRTGRLPALRHQHSGDGGADGRRLPRYQRPDCGRAGCAGRACQRGQIQRAHAVVEGGAGVPGELFRHGIHHHGIPQ